MTKVEAGKCCFKNNVLTLNLMPAAWLQKKGGLGKKRRKKIFKY